MADAIPMEVECRVCGELWTPDRRDYVLGQWRECPRCRHGPDRPSTPPRGDVGPDDEEVQTLARAD